MDLPFRPTLGTPMNMPITKMDVHMAERTVGAHVTLPGFKFGALPTLAKEFASVTQFLHL